MPADPARRPTVLLAEDDANVRETTIDLLSLIDVKVQGVASGREAAQVLEAEGVDLIITDMIMPDGDGRWLLHHVRTTPRLAATRVIMLSARADLDDVAAGLSAGADEYLTKPFDPEKLLAVVQHWLRAEPRQAE
ncbi:MAG: response regulator [Verrucomicrobia bacterium]|jgi:DNA-binding response OmpR family regulator|nr:response regulator [Verrucomicrobiota bacterium]